ncbi:MAG: protein-glutamate O-methyltransferase CheR [Planctomycetaceae bacterium]|nr:protein-glutamate O-methyltransferase CheR [Planctomycetaceae bacterium]
MSEALFHSTVMTEEEFETISAFVKSTCGINLHAGKKELVKARLSKRMRMLKLDSFEKYFAHVQRDVSGIELMGMLDCLSTNLTSFFREPAHFELLAKVMGELLATNAQTRKLRIWSAGCSSGEEPYTLAMTLAETAGQCGYDMKILASDLSTRVLAAARRGVYPHARLRGVPGELTSRYFTLVQARPERLYQVNESLRSLITFARVNLMESWPMAGPFDVIFCRNVMIYFDKDTQTRLVSRFQDMLRPGGLLFVGHSESLSGVRHNLEYVQPAVYRRRGRGD